MKKEKPIMKNNKRKKKKYELADRAPSNGRTRKCV